MFYFLLCIILLLVVFIFLRDKQLRMRINSFLAGARRRSVLIRLKFQLNKEKQKRGSLLRQLGERAWEKDIPVEGGEFIRSELGRLLERKKSSQLEWKKAIDELDRLHRELADSIRLYQEKLQEKLAEKSPFEELIKRKKKEEKNLAKSLRHDPRSREKLVQEVRREKLAIRGKIEAYKEAVKEIEAEAHREQRPLEKSLRYWEKLKERLEHRIRNIEIQEKALFYSLGKNLEQARVRAIELESLYSEIDTVNHRISTLLHRIETLSGG